MDITSNTPMEANSILQRLKNDISLLEQVHEDTKRNLDVCNVELQTAKNDVLVARQQMDREATTLRNSLQKEKTDNERNCEKITGLTEELRVAKEGTTQLQKNINDLKDKVENEQVKLANEIDTLKEKNKGLRDEKVKIAKYLSKLGNEVNFQRRSNTDMLDSAELENLFQHIQEIKKAGEIYIQKLQHLIQLENVANESSIVSSNALSPAMNDASTERNTETNQVGSQAITRPVASSSMASSSSNQHSIKKKETSHELDAKFDPKYGFKCICGKIVQHEQSFKNHIRRFTEKLKFLCGTCNKSFLHKSGLTKHFQSEKCKMAKKQQIKLKMEDKTLRSLAKNPKQYVQKSIRHRIGYQSIQASRIPVSGGSQKGKLVCHQDKCHARFKELISLKIHLTGVHHIQDPLSKWGTACKSCGKFLEDWKALKKHHKESTECTSAYNAM